MARYEIMDFTEPKLYLLGIKAVVKFTTGIINKRVVELEIDQLLTTRVFPGIAPLEVIVIGSALSEFRDWDLDKNQLKAYKIRGKYEIISKKIMPVERIFSLDFLKSNMDVRDYIKFIRDYKGWLNGNKA